MCDKLVDYFENTPYKNPGSIRDGQIDLSCKDSTDAGLLDSDLWREYHLDYLQPCANLYRQKYMFADAYAKWSVTEVPNIQKYNPGQGFYVWHTERSNNTPPSSMRHLTYMTYLNDVEDGGGTEFYHQKIITKARKGLTLIWPVDWTFTHRGVVSQTQTKYIITGWYSYIE